MHFALIVSQYHDFVTARLEAGARAVLVERGVSDGDITTLTVPGAYELPQAAARVARTGQWSAVVCLGCLIKGETPHFDYIAQAAAHGIMRAAQETGVPIAFGSDAIHDLPGYTRGTQAMMWIDSYADAGMPPRAILQAMTGTAARLLGVDAERGAIRVGLAADLIAVPGDPLADVQTLKQVMFVMKDGRVIRSP